MSTTPTPRPLPPNPSLEHLRKMAKALLKRYRAGDTSALESFKRFWPRAGKPGLQDAQHVLACEHGFAGWARLKQHLEKVKMPNDYDERVWGPGTWPFFTACLEGRPVDMQRMLGQRPWLARASYAYYEPLHYAVRGGNQEVVKSLLNAGADPLAPGWQRRFGDDTPLAWAKHRGLSEIVRLLEKPSRMPRPKPDEDNSWKPGDPLNTAEKEIEQAANRGDHELVLNLLGRHPGIAQAGFYEAVHHGHERIVRILIEHGADPQKPSPWACWFTPLMHCLRYTKPRYAIAKLLLDRGVSPDERNGLGMTTLHLLMVEGSPEAAQWLLDHKATIDLIDFQFSSTALGWAARWGRSDMTTLLLDHGADPAAPQDQPWATPLAWSEKMGHHSISEKLRKFSSR